jgi:DNA-directed RNA polymerase specialized sigma24 family protein
MNGTASPLPLDELSLDELSDLAESGDRPAADCLFRLLRVRLIQVAKHRVQDADAQDLVQDALRIVLERHHERRAGSGILVWSLAVLRNVIGNYYQARKRERRHLSLGEGPDTVSTTGLRSGTAGGGEVELPGGSELVERMTLAVESLARRYPRCGGIFRAILESLDGGGGPRDVSSRALEKVRREFPDLSSGSFYVALHRCRTRLRDLLAESGGGRLT